MVHTVTITDFYALRDASARLGQGAAQGADLALNGCQIIAVAEQQGHEDWAREFAASTKLQLTTLRQRLFDNFISAAQRFTGEHPALDETFESYQQRINEVIEDSSGLKLHLMMVRNGITLIHEVAT